MLVESVPIEKAFRTSRYEGRGDGPDSLKVAKYTVGAVLDRWLPQHEVAATTRMNYEFQIRTLLVHPRGAFQ